MRPVGLQDILDFWERDTTPTPTHVKSGWATVLGIWDEFGRLCTLMYVYSWDERHLVFDPQDR